MTNYEPNRPSTSEPEPVHVDPGDCPNTSPALTRRSFLMGGGATVAALMLPYLGIFDGKRAYALDPTAESDADNPTTQFILLCDN